VSGSEHRIGSDSQRRKIGDQGQAHGGEKGRPRTQPDLYALQRTAGNQAAGRLMGPRPNVDGVPPTGGDRLAPSVRSDMESRFRRDFSQVRVHTGVEGGNAARALNARAYTVGRDVVFGHGEYAPETGQGRTLLAHELVHVVQQRPHDAGAAGPGEAQASFEQEADRAAAGVLEGGTVGAGLATPTLTSGPAVMRQGPAPAGPYTGYKSFPPSPAPPKAPPAAPAKPQPAKLDVFDHGASADAAKVAKERMTEVIGNLQTGPADQLAGTEVELHIIPKDKKLTDLPEYSALKGTKTFDGRSYDELRGAGGQKFGSKIRYAIAEEQLVPGLAKKDSPESRYGKGFVGTHESGHVVEQYALTKDQQAELKKLYDERKKGKGAWLSPEDYTSANAGEYFAQSTSAYFGRPYSEDKADKKMYTRDWLRKNDPDMLKLLSKVYK
jgi:hypothetical protein